MSSKNLTRWQLWSVDLRIKEEREETPPGDEPLEVHPYVTSQLKTVVAPDIFTQYVFLLA